jgi:hypothetical protein
MSTSRQAILRPLLVGLGGGLIVGCLVGWLLLGWFAFPVSYELAPTAKEQYVRLVSDSYALRRDPQAARQQLAIEGITVEEAGQIADRLIADYEAKGQTVPGQQLRNLKASLSGTPVAPLPEGETPAAPPGTTPAVPEGVTAAPTATAAISTPTPAPTSFLSSALPFCLIGLLLVLVGAAAVFLVLRRQRAAKAVGAGARPSKEKAPPWTGVGPPPLSQWVSTYNLGMDNFDESFSIETPTGEFLGECGMGISEVLGPEAPRRVTAFEVWLFDKSDIRTVTKVLMSEHAYYDDTLKAKLSPKGEPVLAEPGATFTLETTSLRVDAEVLGMDYGDGMGAANSHFKLLKVSLATHAKEGAVGREMPIPSMPGPSS